MQVYQVGNQLLNDTELRNVSENLHTNNAFYTKIIDIVSTPVAP